MFNTVDEVRQAVDACLTHGYKYADLCGKHADMMSWIYTLACCMHSPYDPVDDGTTMLERIRIEERDDAFEEFMDLMVSEIASIQISLVESELGLYPEEES